MTGQSFNRSGTRRAFDSASILRHFFTVKQSCISNRNHFRKSSEIPIVDLVNMQAILNQRQPAPKDSGKC